MTDLLIREDDLTDPHVRELVTLHLEGMHDNSPQESVFALGISSLQQPDISVWTAWHSDRVAGMGALKQVNRQTGEIKSMRTHPDFLRMGIAAALLEHIIGEAQSRFYDRLCLETGSGEAFEPALKLYRRRGFTACDAFGEYEKSAFNQFMHLPLVQ
ncbi:MAG: GNAT family N-acetyltransferase [Parasphingorhabdus sp.]